MSYELCKANVVPAKIKNKMTENQHARAILSYYLFILPYLFSLEVSSCVLTTTRITSDTLQFS